MSSDKQQIDPVTLKVPKPTTPPPSFKVPLVVNAQAQPLSPAYGALPQPKAQGQEVDPPAADSTPTGPAEPGEAGEGGRPLLVSNSEFIAAVFPQVPNGASPAVCSKGGDPNEGGWYAVSAGDRDLPADANNYICSSSFTSTEDGTFNVRKAQFAAYHFILLDDLGTKVPMERLAGFELTWLIETSPGNYQAGIVLADPITDPRMPIDCNKR